MGHREGSQMTLAFPETASSAHCAVCLVPRDEWQLEKRGSPRSVVLSPECLQGHRGEMSLLERTYYRHGG
jgi:hypothetical protein